MKYYVKRFSATRPVIEGLRKEATGLLKKGLTGATPEGRKFLLRSGHLSNSYGKIAKKGKILVPSTWKQSMKAQDAQKEVGAVMENYRKGGKL